MIPWPKTHYETIPIIFLLLLLLFEIDLLLLGPSWDHATFWVMKSPWGGGYLDITKDMIKTWSDSYSAYSNYKQLEISEDMIKAWSEHFWTKAEYKLGDGNILWKSWFKDRFIKKTWFENINLFTNMIISKGSQLDEQFLIKSLEDIWRWKESLKIMV